MYNLGEQFKEDYEEFRNCLKVKRNVRRQHAITIHCKSQKSD